MSFSAYVRPVHYYETDKMGIVHHSNYIRWLEEARLDLMAQLGIDYGRMEAQNILIPVVDVSCKYLTPAKYGDTVRIRPTITQYSGVRLCFSYEIEHSTDGALLATATSSHCFVGKDFRPISLKRTAPELHDLFEGLLRKE